MIREKIVCLIVFIVTIYWFFVYKESSVAFLLALEIVYFFGAFLFCLIEKKKISVSLEKMIFTVEKNQAVPIQVSVQNKSKIFSGHLRLYFRIENSLTNEKTKFHLAKTISPNSKKILSIPVSANHCGNMIITLKKVKVYDLFMFVGSMKKIKERVQVRILPESHLLPIEITKKTRDFIADADEYSDKESGDDSSEIYQIREYTDKDSIHDIHWKLSAKADQLMVKEYGKALGSAVLIWINTSGRSLKLNKSKGKSVAQRFRKRKSNAGNLAPEVLEIVASISLSLFEEECIHTVAWYEPDNELVRKKRISKEINVYELMNRLALIKPYADEERLGVIYKDSFRGENFSTMIEVKTNGNIFVNDTKIELAINKGKIEWEKLAFTV